MFLLYQQLLQSLPKLLLSLNKQSLQRVARYLFLCLHSNRMFSDTHDWDVDQYSNEIAYIFIWNQIQNKKKLVMMYIVSKSCAVRCVLLDALKFSAVSRLTSHFSQRLQVELQTISEVTVACQCLQPDGTCIVLKIFSQSLYHFLKDIFKMTMIVYVITF